MLIGLDASGSFLPGEGEPRASAVAAAVVPRQAATDIARWTTERLRAWGRRDLYELHAAELNWDQRREVCAMLGQRSDVRVSVVVTTSLHLRSAAAVARHRERQAVAANQSWARARSAEGKERGRKVDRLLRGKRVGQNRLQDDQYVLATMVPYAVVGAVQRAFCFFGGTSWRNEMTEIELVMDEETPAAARLVSESLLPIIGGDDRFRLISPLEWHSDPVHPLVERALHPDGDGYSPDLLIGDTIAWKRSHDVSAIQVADMVAWTVCRTISRPHESQARDCYEHLVPILAGERGRCFETFSIGASTDADVLTAHLHAPAEPAGWLTRASASGSPTR